MSDLEYDPSDPEQVDQAEQAAGLRTQEQFRAVHAVLSTYEGREFVWMLMQKTQVGQSAFAGEAPMTTAYNLALRDVGEWARDWVFTVAPERYMIMEREALEREQRYAEAVGLDDETSEE